MSTEVADISVIIPAYNAAWCVAKAISSVLAQSIRAAEIIVVNDGSTDNTKEVLEPFLNDIVVIEQLNAGLSNARNTGIKRAKSKYIAFLDADDYWHKDKLERQQALLDSDQELGFCSTAAEIVNDQGEIVGSWLCPDISEATLESIFTRNATVAGSGSGVLARRELFSSVGLFDESLESLEDIDMWMRLAAVSRYACIADKLTFILKRTASMSGNLEMMERSAFRVMLKNRHLLAPGLRGRFWQACYANTLADYAKWQYREGHRWRAIRYLMEGFYRAPIKRGRLMLGLMLAMLMGQVI